eukprot:7381681-Prymnesium_polylepis.2
MRSISCEARQNNFTSERSCVARLRLVCDCVTSNARSGDGRIPGQKHHFTHAAATDASLVE